WLSPAGLVAELSPARMTDTPAAAIFPVRPDRNTIAISFAYERSHLRTPCAMGLYLRPHTIDEAIMALASSGLTVLAGGTDFYPLRVGRPLDDDVLDITAIDSLRAIREADGHWRLGATATWRDVIEAALPPLFDALKLAAREVGGAQIQNTGTVAGN